MKRELLHSFLPGGKVVEKEMKFRFNAEVSKESCIQILDEMDFNWGDVFRENVLSEINEGTPGDSLWTEPWRTNAVYLRQMFCVVCEAGRVKLEQVLCESVIVEVRRDSPARDACTLTYQFIISVNDQTL